MNGFLDDLLVGLALLASVGYALYSLGPKALRTRLFAGMSSLLERLPIVGLRGAAQRLAAAAESKGQGSCGGCDNCGSEQAPVAKSPTAEVRVPFSAIGKRQ